MLARDYNGPMCAGAKCDLPMKAAHETLPYRSWKGTDADPVTKISNHFIRAIRAF